MALWGASLRIGALSMLCALCMSQGHAAVTASGVPEGFEEFFEPQTTAVDVFFGGTYIATTMATYTPTSLEFLVPDEVNERLDDVLNPDDVLQMLSQPLEPNSDLVCYDKSQSDCGQLATENIGIIFDEGRFRVDVFIHPNLLAVREAITDRYLPAATTEFSHINNLSAVLSGGSGEDNFNLQGQTLLSQQEQRVQALWNVDNNDGLAIDELFWQKDDKDVQYQAGWFSTSSRYLDFIGTEELMGARYSTSLKVRTDLDYARGSPLQVFLSSRSLVNLLKDGRIVSTQFYDAGNQLLDTSALPEGAYDVEIQVTGLGEAAPTVIRRFFTKTPRIPPLDMDLYYVEAGGITQVGNGTHFPESQSEFTLRGGYSHRLRDDLGLDVAGAFAASDVVAEAGLYYIQPRFTVQPKLMLGTGGDVGLSAYTFGRYQQLSGSYTLRRIWSNNHRDLSGDYQLIKGAIVSHNLNLNHPLYEGQLGFNLSVDKRGDAPTNTITSVSYDKVLHRGLYDQWDLSTEYTVDDADRLFFIKLSWRRTTERITHTAYSELRNEDTAQRDSTYLRAGYNGTWSDGERYPNDVQLRWDANIDRFRQDVGVEGSVNGHFGRSRAAVEHVSDDNSGDRTIYLASFSTSIAGEKDRVGWGGKQSAQAGLLLHIEGDAQDAWFDIYINDRLHGQAKVGQTVSVPVRPYESYSIKLKDRGTDFIAFDDAPKDVTLYPGNVKHFTWKAEALKVMIGRLVRRIPGCRSEETGFEGEYDKSCWVPMVRARLNGAHGWASTDDEGLFQAEIKTSATLLEAIRKDYRCTVNLPSLHSDDGLIYLEEDLRCEGEEPELPDTEVKCSPPVNDSSIRPDDRTRVIHIGNHCR